MTTLLDAARQALGALEWNYNTDLDNIPACVQWAKMLQENITSLRQAIEQAQHYVMENAQGELERISLVQTGVGIGKPEQEPVAWIEHIAGGVEYNPYHKAALKLPEGMRFDLYTTPPQRKPLTDEEIDRVTDQQWASNNHKPIYAAHRAYARAIERSHGIGGGE